MPTPVFATFWHGPLNPTVYSCLASFPASGASLRLYTYESSLDAPEGVEVADARSICPDESLLHRYLSAGKPSVATFSDRFRYSLIRQTGCCWVDTDIICLKQPNFQPDEIILGCQTEAHGKALINNAVMRLPPDHPVLDEMLAKAEALVDVDMSWGAIGPFMLTEIAEKHEIYGLARDPSDFYPIGPDQFWQVLLPSYRETVHAAVAGATFLHLWSELLRRSTYDMARRPPVGSYLHDIFLRLETLDRFRDAYSEAEIAVLMAEWMVEEAAPTTTRPPPSAPAELEGTFDEIMTANRWGGGESRSGPGSTLNYTYNLRHELESFIPAFGISTFFDAPCGDFNWMKEVSFPRGVNYIGGEIVTSLVRFENKNYANASRRFIVFDITKDEFPECDLWFCRDCLFHLPTELILRALRGFCNSRAKLLMMTNHLNTSGFTNSDIPSGEFRLLDFFSEPFNLPREVLYRIADYVYPFPQREMCVWSRAQIVTALERRSAENAALR
jgi:hypothetical protein